MTRRAVWWARARAPPEAATLGLPLRSPLGWGRRRPSFGATKLLPLLLPRHGHRRRRRHCSRLHCCNNQCHYMADRNDSLHPYRNWNNISYYHNCSPSDISVQPAPDNATSVWARLFPSLMAEPTPMPAQKPMPVGRVFPSSSHSNTIVTINASCKTQAQ